MAQLELNKFNFPDEEPEVTEEEIEIEIIDDVPEEDRKNANPMPKNIVEEIDNDDLEAYTGQAKERLLQMKKIMHDERRAKEEALREQQEAIRVAQQLVNENKNLKGRLSTGEQTLVNTYKENVIRELDDAKREYKDAYDSGDSERLSEAQEKLIDVKMKSQQIDQYKPEFAEDTLQDEETNVQMPQQPQRLEPNTQAWLDKNSWYGTDDDMSYLAMGIHRRLEREGVALGSPHYFSVIDKEMRQRFPEKFDDEPSETEIKTSAKKPSNVVAPATRSTSPKRVKLTQTQLGLAKKFNLTPEQYARELTKLESQNDR
jgi:hypothetical protein